jgi:hypothetical protein
MAGEPIISPAELWHFIQNIDKRPLILVKFAGILIGEFNPGRRLSG